MSTWLPESERDTRYNIWYKRYRCKVHFAESRGVEDIRTNGMPSSGDPYYDREIADQLVIRMLTIDQMVEFYKRSVRIYVVNASDTKLIYEDIVAHLKAWKAYLNTSFSDPSAPLDDLRLMDQFAKIIYKHAVYQFPDNYLEDAISKRMQSLFGFTREAFSGKKEEENIPKSEMKHTTLFAEDNPIANFFQHNNKKGIDDEQWRKVFKV